MEKATLTIYKKNTFYNQIKNCFQTFMQFHFVKKKTNIDIPLLLSPVQLY